MHALTMDLDYGLTRKLAVNVGVPFMSGKYTGAFPHLHPGHRNIDDGKYYGGFQDFRFGLRYNLVRSGPLVITPFVDGVVPSHNYEIMAHSAVGRNLRELLVGTNVGWQLEPVLPNAYVQARLSYGFVERVLGRSHNRTNIDADFGYFLTPRVALSGLATFAKHHGGLVAGQQFTDDEFEVHNQLFRYDTLDVGGGAAFLVNRSTSVFAALLTTVWSRNAHVLRPGFIVGINWRFRTRRPQPATSAFIPEAESSDRGENSAVPARRPAP